MSADPENKEKQKVPQKTISPFLKKRRLLDRPLHIYCGFVLKIFQKGHGYLCQHCQMLNHTNASIWKKKRFKGCLAKTNYTLTLRYECVCLGGLSWRVQQLFECGSSHSFWSWLMGDCRSNYQKQRAKASPVHFLRNATGFLAQELPLPCMGLWYSPRSSGPANRKHFHLQNWPLTCNTLYFKEPLFALNSTALHTAKNCLQ